MRDPHALLAEQGQLVFVGQHSHREIEKQEQPLPLANSSAPLLRFPARIGFPAFRWLQVHPLCSGKTHRLRRSCCELSEDSGREYLRWRSLVPCPRGEELLR